MSDQNSPAGEKPSSPQEPQGVAAATAAGAAAGPAGGVAALRGAYSRARSFVERPRWRGLVVLGVIAVALVAAFFLVPWQVPQGGADARQETANRIAALEQDANTLKSDMESTARRLSALERAYEELAAEGAVSGDMESISERIAGLVTTLELLSTRVDALEMRESATGEGGRPQAPADTTELRARLSELESDLNALNAAVKGRLDGLEARIGNDFANRLASVEQAQASGPSKADIEGLAARMTLVESNEGVAAVRRATRALAVSALAQAVRSDAPFSAEIALVSDLVGEDPALAALKARAEEGVPSTATLQREFADASHAAIAARDEALGGGFFARAWRSITSLVTVRRTGGTSGNDLEAVLARVQSALSRQDVAAAVSEAQAVSGAPQKALAPWLDKAQAHIEAEKALRALQAAVLRDLAQN
jgi:hypothetical protein